MRAHSRAGFTVTEILVAIAVFAVVAGAITPIVVKQIERARKARALQDIATLAESIHTFRQDVKDYPDRRGGVSRGVGYLLSDGDAPSGLGKWKGPASDVAGHLVENTPEGSPYPTTGVAIWSGPYLPRSPADPWGRAYAVSVAGIRGDSGLRGWILSAGPNGRVETDDGDEEIPDGSDDVGWRIR